MKLGNAKDWRDRLIAASGQPGFVVSDWILVQSVAYEDYPCRLLSEFIIIDALLSSGRFHLVDDKRSEENHFEITATDNSKDICANRRKLEIGIRFDPPNYTRGIVFHCWRSNSNRNNDCCRKPEGKHLPPCEFVKKQRKL